MRTLGVFALAQLTLVGPSDAPASRELASPLGAGVMLEWARMVTGNLFLMATRALSA